MKRHMVAGNWKMNNTLDEGLQLIYDIKEVLLQRPTDVEVVIGTPFIHLSEAADMLITTPIYLAAQNCHQEASGAYTGEVSADMLKSVGTDYVILGHSERRQYFNETDAIISAKTMAALAAGLKVIWCCGEPLEVREQNQQEAYVKNQMEAGILVLDKTQLADVVIAYEPIWAIGTGKTASAQQAQDMHAFIRGLLANTFDDLAQQVTILYGGSCKPSNAVEIFSQPDVDGGLIGGASLNADDFTAIVHSF